MSRRTDAGWENLADKLPFQPCGDLQNDVLEDIYDNDMLGTGIMLYSRESVETANPIAQIMDAEDWDRWEKSRKRRWGARCTCSACGEEFFAGYVSDSGTSGIVLRQGEDGQIYDGYVDKGDDDAQIFFDDETIVCPRCYQSVVVTRRSELRQGRTLQALQAETLNIDGYLAVLYWMVARYQDNTGTDVATFSPHAALIVDRCGVLRRFRAVRHSNEARDVTWTELRPDAAALLLPRRRERTAGRRLGMRLRPRARRNDGREDGTGQIHRRGRNLAGGVSARLAQAPAGGKPDAAGVRRCGDADH